MRIKGKQKCVHQICFPFFITEKCMSKEIDLLKRLGDPSTQREAFAEVVHLYSRTLYMQIRRLIKWHDDADDVLQNTFLKAWSAIGNFRGDSQLSTWLYRIAMNESLNFLQKRQAMEAMAEPEEAAKMTLESDPYFDGDRAEILLQEAIDTLPEKQRIVFCMKYFDEMKYEEMSHILETSVGALKASYHIAVKKIEAYFQSKD